MHKTKWKVLYTSKDYDGVVSNPPFLIKGYEFESPK